MALTLVFFSLFVRADVSFENIDIKVNNVKAHVKLADNDERREHGLMFVPKLATDEGMLFVFDDERILNFWMKNTLVPLSIGFFDSEGVLVNKQEMQTDLMEQHPPTYSSGKPATFALEMPQGWFDKNHIKLGEKLSVIRTGKSALLKQKVQFSTRQTSSGHSH